jgi:saposin
LIVGFVEDKVGSNATLEKIEEFLNTTVCDLLPSFLSAECAALVDEYAVPLAKHIITGEPAAKVCADVHLCSPSKATEFKRVVKQAKAIAYAKEVIVCDVCKLIVGYAEDYLTKNSTIADITKFLNTSVCGKLPSFLSAECAALVDEYAPELAQHIIRGESPVQACTEVHLCAATKKLAEKAAAKKVKPEANAIECAVCRLVVNAAEEELGNSRTDHEVESFLNNTICVRLPGFFKGLCASFVDSYFPELVGKLLTDYNATRVCGEIGVCSTSSEQVSYHNFVETVPAKKRN